MENTKQSILSLVDNLLSQKVISPSDLRRYVRQSIDDTDPEFIREEMETWYRNAGIESIIGKKLELSPCPFTAEEILEAQQNQETILCVPKGISREEFGELFHIKSWALHDPLVTPAIEQEDCWFKVSMSLTPSYMNKSGIELCHQFEDEKKMHFSLERYLVFIARIRYLTGKTPDSEYWIWIPRGRYDRSGMLIAGFDRNASFNVHGWMPQFSASFLGARYGIAPKSSIQ
ncbi:MAG TPA: hypothetical protein VIO64_19460 [Pseudobacteroides sp.]|uniref:hypothetical protein n=1 Tax=Pseudobacteroides sp. TaxID=1968840 RepID=UPI002F92A661